MSIVKTIKIMKKIPLSFETEKDLAFFTDKRKLQLKITFGILNKINKLCKNNHISSVKNINYVS